MRNKDTLIITSWFWVILPLLVLFLHSCTDSNTLYTGSASPVNANWHQDSSLVFKVGIKDLNVPCNIEFGLNINNTYPYSNIWLFVKMTDPKGNIINERVEYSLCNKKGEWWGNKSRDVWIQNTIYKTGVTFLVEGDYTFEFKQGMRKELLDGFKQLDFRIKKIGKINL